MIDYVRRFSILFTVATALNYPWELAQAPLYVGMATWDARRWHCFVASLGDGLLIWMIFAIGWAVFKSAGWYKSRGIRALVLMSATGLVISVGIEWIAINTFRRWQHTPAMPLIPGLGVGLAPVLQMMLLPPVIFHIAALWMENSLVVSNRKRNDTPS